jgi:methylmalonyl-CoA mutase cobalamin-binding domain/chain
VTKLEMLAQSVELGNARAVCGIIQELLEAGRSPDDILRLGVMPGLQTVGDKFEAQEYFIPEMLRAARAAKLGAELLHASIPKSAHITNKKMVMGTVRNDLHDIGKNLVVMAVEGLGVEVVDLGVDVSPEQFVRAAERDESVAIVGVSALLTTTLPAMEQTVRALRECRAANRIKIFVGGAPVTQALADQYGADVFTDSAFEAARRARAIIDEQEAANHANL